MLLSLCLCSLRGILLSFFSYFFLVLARAEREMTATEIMERQAEKAVLLGPQVDRLEQEGLAKVFDIVSDIADNANRLPEHSFIIYLKIRLHLIYSI